jgi:death-on-curing protein
MKKIQWLSEEFVLAAHQRQIAEHGGGAGIRDFGLLSSALARPKNILAYKPEADVTELAAAYAYGITKNHPFIDGNKRIAFIAMYIFLRDNNHNLIFGNEEEEYLIMLQLADGSLSEQDLIEWIRKNLI